MSYFSYTFLKSARMMGNIRNDEMDLSLVVTNRYCRDWIGWRYSVVYSMVE